MNTEQFIAEKHRVQEAIAELEREMTEIDSAYIASNKVRSVGERFECQNKEYEVQTIRMGYRTDIIYDCSRVLKSGELSVALFPLQKEHFEFEEQMQERRKQMQQ